MGDIVIGRRDQCQPVRAALNHHSTTACLWRVETIVDRSCFFFVFRGHGFKPAMSLQLSGECALS